MLVGRSIGDYGCATTSRAVRNDRVENSGGVLRGGGRGTEISCVACPWYAAAGCRRSAIMTRRDGRDDQLVRHPQSDVLGRRRCCDAYGISSHDAPPRQRVTVGLILKGEACSRHPSH